MVFLRWLEDEKEWLTSVETDIRDAKRRINLRKPRPRKATDALPKQSSASEDEASD